MQLPDEAIAFQYQGLLVPGQEEWTAAAELRQRHFLSAARLRAVQQQLMQIRSQLAAERELRQTAPEQQPLESGFIDWPQKTLEQARKKGQAGDLERILAVAARLKAQVDRIVVLGVGGATLGMQALFQALCSRHHNELSSETRLGVPKFYFADNAFDNDSIQDLVDLLQNTCVDPELREERWGLIVVSKSGDTLDVAAVYRIFRREATEYYGSHSDKAKQLFVPITGASGKLRELSKADGFSEDEIFTLPENIGSRYAVLTAAGLLPAAAMGLDVRALLLGAQAMTRTFLEEPFERNPVLQFAAVNHLMTEELGKTIRVLAVWSGKLEALGRWYETLVCEGLGKQGRGPTPLTVVQPRDLHARGQQLQDGARDKLTINVTLKGVRSAPIALGMADRNQDDLNALCRKTLPDLSHAVQQALAQAELETARPAANLVLPGLTEHSLGQLMQLLMLATVVEGRLMGINPYGHPGLDGLTRRVRSLLRP